MTNSTAPPPYRLVSTSVSHTLHLDLNGTVWASGDNHSGQLGLGDNDNRQLPTKIITIPVPIQHITAGDQFSVFLDTNGAIWTTGSNKYGELGLSDNFPRCVPTKVQLPFAVRSISAGYHHVLLVDSKNRVWSFGRNDSGQLGLGDVHNRNQPCQISRIRDILSVSAGRRHSLFLDHFGRVRGCGSDRHGQLGIKRKLNIINRVKMWAISTRDQRVYSSRTALSTQPNNDHHSRKILIPRRIHGLPEIAFINANEYSSLMSDSTGRMWNSSGIAGVDQASSKRKSSVDTTSADTSSDSEPVIENLTAFGRKKRVVSARSTLGDTGTSNFDEFTLSGSQIVSRQDSSEASFYSCEDSLSLSRVY